MTEKIKLSLSGMWLIASLSALILPIFLPSYPSAFNVIQTSTITMFLLSFPSSLFGSPFLYAAYSILDIDTNSIWGAYTHLSMLFLIGVVQWFWLVPRIWFGGPSIQTLQNAVPELQPSSHVDFDQFRSRERTPLETVFDEDRGK